MDAKHSRHLEGERTREPALDWRPPNWHESRKKPAHHVIQPRDRATVVYLTVCTEGRMPWLATDDVHILLREVWSGATAWLVGRYVIMPDHLHCFAGWSGGKWPLETWMRYWKRLFSQRHGNRLHVWQSGHWDATMMTSEQCNAKWKYVIDNPVRHGFVTEAKLWPYAGEVHEFIWP